MVLEDVVPVCVPVCAPVCVPVCVPVYAPVCVPVYAPVCAPDDVPACVPDNKAFPEVQTVGISRRPGTISPSPADDEA
ncbi:MAG: hypothetical protein ACI4FZ_08970 [Lachnospiraceae bacterium]